ncbi:MAG: hypothetical protein JWM47_3242 [Acidimicrobiales bacterium]|nr:hypothetical protein [Acidimicrobiales bacterium]
MSADQRRLQFTGLVGSGKSTLARRLAQHEGGVVLSFASRVYELVELVIGAPVDKVDPRNRQLLKLIGTEWGREGLPPPPEVWEKIDGHLPPGWGLPDVWARALVERCEELDAETLVVNDDLRFANELAFSDHAGFVPFLVACRNETRLGRLAGRGEHYDGNDRHHESEMLVNALHEVALEEDLISVVWVDDPRSKPDQPWVHQVEGFEALVRSSATQQEILDRIGWGEDRRRALIAFTRSVADQRGSDRLPPSPVPTRTSG